ncbi:MAG TPA: hypothetical protein VI322_03205 [Candidatus Saccharimonadia bacterium]
MPSTSGVTGEEMAIGLTPLWVKLDQLNDLTVGSTVDWRTLILPALP